MTKLIINSNDGTVVEIEGSMIVDLDQLDSESKMLWAEWLDTGSDTVAREVAERVGKPLLSMLENCGYGDLKYGNTLAYSPQAIRDEIFYMKEGGWDEEWVEKAEHLSTEQLEMIGSGILQGDYLWGVWKEELIEALREFDYSSVESVDTVKTSQTERNK